MEFKSEIVEIYIFYRSVGDYSFLSSMSIPVTNAWDIHLVCFPSLVDSTHTLFLTFLNPLNDKTAEMHQNKILRSGHIYHSSNCHN